MKHGQKTWKNAFTPRAWWGLLSFWFMSLLPVTLETVHTLPSVIFCSYHFSEQSYNLSFSSPGHLFFSFIFWVRVEQLWHIWAGMIPPKNPQVLLTTVYLSVFPLFVKEKICLDGSGVKDEHFITQSLHKYWMNTQMKNVLFPCVCAEPFGKVFYKHYSRYLGVIFYLFILNFYFFYRFGVLL